MSGARVLGRHLVVLASLLEKNSYKARIINNYGLSECCGLTAYNIDRSILLSNNKIVLDNDIPLGRPLPGRQLYLINDKNEMITDHGIIGVIYVNDGGNFQGYRGQTEATAKTKVLLPNVGPGLFVRTGDLAYYNDLGDLIHVGREDFRVKIFGQLVAPEEIEQAVIRASENVEACVVRIETYVHDGINREDSEYWSCHVLAPKINTANHAYFINHLESYCRQNLPSAMLPAAWKVYNEFPYLSVGKIDRCGFSKLERTGTALLSANQSTKFESTTSPTQRKLLSILPKIFIDAFMLSSKIVDSFNVEASFTELGGSSVGIARAIIAIKQQFNVAITAMTLFENPSVQKLARVLAPMLDAARNQSDEQKEIKGLENTRLFPTKCIRGPLSVPQAISISDLDMIPEIPIQLANMSILYEVALGCVSVKRLRHAMREVVAKQAVLRTSFHLDSSTNQWYQQIEEPTDEGFAFTETELCQPSDTVSLVELLARERSHYFFKFDGSRRVHLHVVRRRLKDKHQQQDDRGNIDNLCMGDLIIITVRHESIDYTSEKYLLDDLVYAYINGQLPIHPDDVSYLDYAIYDRQRDRSASFAYWQEHQRNLNGAEFVSRIPCDHSWIPHPPAVVLANPIPSIVDKTILHAMLQCADSCNTTLATVCLASFAVFVYDLTNSWHEDIGITYIMASRPTEPEAGGLVGPFMYLKLLRMHLENNGHTSFMTFLHWVRSVVMEGFEHVRATKDPLATINQEPTQLSSLPAEMCPCAAVQFDIEESNHLILDDSGEVRLDVVRDEHDRFPLTMWWRYVTNDYWITLFYYNPEDDELRWVFVLPATLFERPTAEKLGSRFEKLLERLFGKETTADDRLLQPLSAWVQQ